MTARFREYGSGYYGEYEFKPEEWTNYNPPQYRIEQTVGSVKFEFIDTYTLFGMKLETLTADTPFPKRKDGEVWHGKPWRWWRAHPDCLFAEDERAFWAYGENDVRALEYSVNYWREWIWDKWKIDILREKTFSSIALRILRGHYLNEPLEPYEKRETLTKRGRPKKEFRFDQSKRALRTDFMLGYYGGRRPRRDEPPARKRIDPT